MPQMIADEVMPANQRKLCVNGLGMFAGVVTCLTSSNEQEAGRLAKKYFTPTLYMDMELRAGEKVTKSYVADVCRRFAEAALRCLNDHPIGDNTNGKD